MATVTASDQLALPRLNEIGVITAKTNYLANGATVSAGDVVLAVKIPNGVTVLDGYISGIAGNTATVFNVGVAGTANNLAATLTLSSTAVVARFNAGTLPVKVSLSDDANPQYTWMTATVASTASATATASINFVVNYTRNI